MNIYLLVALGIAWLSSVGYAAYLGKDYADAQHAREAAERKAVIEQVREANREFADRVALDTAAAIGKIRIQNRTITNEVRHEREVHHVLNDAACAVPATTVGVLNRSRSDPARPRPSNAAGGVPADGAVTDRPRGAVGGSGTGGLGTGGSVPGVR